MWKTLEVAVYSHFLKIIKQVTLCVHAHARTHMNDTNFCVFAHVLLDLIPS